MARVSSCGELRSRTSRKARQSRKKCGTKCGSALGGLAQSSAIPRGSRLTMVTPTERLLALKLQKMAGTGRSAPPPLSVRTGRSACCDLPVSAQHQVQSSGPLLRGQASALDKDVEVVRQHGPSAAAHAVSRIKPTEDRRQGRSRRVGRHRGADHSLLGRGSRRAEQLTGLLRTLQA